MVAFSFFGRTWNKKLATAFGELNLYRLVWIAISNCGSRIIYVHGSYIPSKVRLLTLVQSIGLYCTYHLRYALVRILESTSHKRVSQVELACS